MSGTNENNKAPNNDRLPQPTATTINAVRLLLAAGTSGNGKYLVTVRGKQIVKIEQVDQVVIDCDPITYNTDSQGDLPGV